jgi:hypothetical protein
MIALLMVVLFLLAWVGASVFLGVMLGRFFWRMGR